MKSSQIILKNPEAQKLLEQKRIIIDNIEINLWTGATKGTIELQEKWNRITSFREINTKTKGENGTIVFTGAMQIPRIEAAEYATKLGFYVRSNVSINTNFIVIGTENVSPNKISKAILLNNKNAQINFIDELTFLELVLDNLDLIEGEFEKLTKTKIKPKKTKSKISKIKKEEKTIIKVSNILKGKKIVISGTFSKHSRNELKELIELNGGKNTSSVSKSTDYFLAGKNVGPSKLEKVEKFGIKKISEDDFLEMLK